MLLAGASDGSSVQAASKAAKPPPSQLFDILPIEGTLETGQTEQVDFSFYAYPGVKASATAVCAVANGPSYEVIGSTQGGGRTLRKVPACMTTESHVVSVSLLPQFQLCGESNSIKFDVTPQFFDCGMQPYDRAVDKEFFISNSGKVRGPSRLQASMQKAVCVGWMSPCRPGLSTLRQHATAR